MQASQMQNRVLFVYLPHVPAFQGCLSPWLQILPFPLYHAPAQIQSLQIGIKKEEFTWSGCEWKIEQSLASSEVSCLSFHQGSKTEFEPKPFLGIPQVYIYFLFVYSIKTIKAVVLQMPMNWAYGLVCNIAISFDVIVCVCVCVCVCDFICL